MQAPGAPITPRYIPALSFRWLTPFYDPLLRWGMREKAFKARLIDRASIQAGQDVLDLGCGTGTLTLMIKQAVPLARVTGLDGDSHVLSMARTKSAQAGLSIRWDLGMACNLPYPDQSFDTVVSSLVIHHLVHQDKLRAFREVLRVLRPGGTFRLLDFGRPFNWLTRIQCAIMRNLEEVGDNFRGSLPAMLRDAAFTHAAEAEAMTTIFGPIWLYDAAKTTH
jgi:ubiquinone/menaquinone biosynthesis C-methylase UbiE